jgi:hypothetical protein
VGKTWQPFDKATPHGTLMSVGLHHGDAKQVYVAARGIGGQSRIGFHKKPLLNPFFDELRILFHMP